MKTVSSDADRSHPATGSDSSTGHQHDGRALFGDRAGQLEAPLDRHAMFEGHVPCVLDDRAVGQRVGVWDADLQGRDA
jgi:hypothetical protein